MGRPAIEARELCLAYGRKVVFEGLSASLGNDASSVALIGPNGSGKTSFIRACLGLLRPRAGGLSVLGLPVGSPRARVLRRRLSWMPQAGAMAQLGISVREYAELSRRAAIWPWRRWRPSDAQAVDAALGFCGLLDLRGNLVQRLSGGQAQRLNMARALAVDADILFMDEPSSHLDAEGRRALTRLLTPSLGPWPLAHRPLLIVASHESEFSALCSSVINLDRDRPC